MEIRHFIKLVTVTLGLVFFSLLITTNTQAQTALQNDFSCADVFEPSQLECSALVSIYNSTSGPSWVNRDGWLTTTTPCSWYGVTCSGGSVTEIHLDQNKQGNGLSGTLPTSIKYLTNLTNLTLGNNRLSSIPAEIGDLSNLTVLRLNANQLKSLPSRIGELSKLTALSLSDNQLNNLPVEVGNLSSLITLTLWSNHLSSLPASIGNLSNLEGLYLSSNQLNSLPAEIGKLSNLKELYVDANQLSSLPAEISNLNLTKFHLAYNRITNLPPQRHDDATQTVAPTNLMVKSLSESSIELTWEPIVFDRERGVYEVSFGTGGDFTVHGTTGNKSAKSYTITGLAPGTSYSFRVRTYTDAHDGVTDHIWDDQNNDLWSDYSEVVSGRTQGPTPVPPTATPLPTFTPSSTNTPVSTSTSRPTSRPTSTSTSRPTSTVTNTPTFTPTRAATATPTETLIPTPEPAPTSTPPVCYKLTLSTDGSGKVPTVSPRRSPGCDNRHYTAGEFIQLTARPAIDRITQSWIGTDDNDSSKADINTFTMPNSSHIIVAVYTKPAEVKPLAVGCNSTTPSGEEQPTSCLVGMVYFNGEPAIDVVVTITNSAGQSAQFRTQKGEGILEKRPYYLFELNNAPLLLEEKQKFSLHVSYEGVSKRLSGLVTKAGHQQIDIVLPNTRTDRPIATINHLPLKSFYKGDNHILKAYGMGQFQHIGSKIKAYRWKIGREILAEAETLTYLIDDLEVGDHQLSFQVQDSRDVWSNPVRQDIRVSALPQVKWTMLLYLAADYKLDGEVQWDRFEAAFDQISQGANNPDLRVAAQIDGYNRAAERWTIEYGLQGPEVSKRPYVEVGMDDPKTLTEFIQWGQSTYPAEHYYLVIADHGQAIQGIAWDAYSDRDDDGGVNSAYLTIQELGEVLTESDIAPIDVLHLDACSMNLFETAYEVHDGVTDVLISSQYLGWNFFPYNRYADLITSDTTPVDLGHGIVEQYSQLAERELVPYTLSALDMTRSLDILHALNDLAGYLADGLLNNKSSRWLSDIREKVQSFYSGVDPEKNPLYHYIDLMHWATLLLEDSDDSELDEKAAILIQELDRFILAEESASGVYEGAEVNLNNAFGISIFYPENLNLISYQKYIQHELFELTQDSRWENFLEYFPKSTNLDMPLLPEPGPLAHLENLPPTFSVPRTVEITLYLPIIQR